MAITFKPDYNGFCFMLDGVAVSISDIIAKGIKPTEEEQAVILGQIKEAYPVGNEYLDWSTNYLNRLIRGE